MNGVVAPGIERVTTQYAPDRHRTPLHHTILVNRLISIMRAGRVEAAAVGCQDPGKTCLVKADEPQQSQTRPIPYRAWQVVQAWLVRIIVRQMLKCHGRGKIARRASVKRTALHVSGGHSRRGAVNGRSATGRTRELSPGVARSLPPSTGAWPGCV